MSLLVSLRHFRPAIVLAALLALAAPALAQVPSFPGFEKYGIRPDNFTLSYCVDPRDPAWEVDKQIADAIAGALLIQPKPTVIHDPQIQNDLDELYRHLLADCDLYFGFKLIADAYPDWLAITAPYYEVGYVLAVKNPDWQKLGDIPRDQPLGPTVGTSADFRLIRYLTSIPEDQRWPRYPMGTDEEALQSVVDSKVAAAIVWAPSLAALSKTHPDFARLRIISSSPLPDETLPVGAVLLSSNQYLRTSVDQAIKSLVADGTIEKILAENHFAAKPPAS
jgi:polar amino acid transport system substrate-binding protein